MTISKMSEQEYLDRLSGLFEKVKAEIHTEDESTTGADRLPRCGGRFGT